MPLSPLGRRALTTVVGVAIAATTVGCGSSDDGYAEAWDGLCGDVAGAFAAFRTDVATAAGRSDDPGDDAATRPASRDEVVGDLEAPVTALRDALRRPWDAVADLEPPERWARWHTEAVEQLQARRRILEDGVRRVAAGDADALASLALGGFGPASADAPQALREATPSCARMR
ncbi:MAG: hypothetical protein M0P31_01660 [Solirubrobacteraceae bacterium]|nr:hypothetical protein [Solirubrobacteraceae bacterium]